MRRIGRDLDHERCPGRLLLDEVHRLGGKYVGQVIRRSACVVYNLAVLVEVVVESQIGRNPAGSSTSSQRPIRSTRVLHHVLEAYIH